MILENRICIFTQPILSCTHANVAKSRQKLLKHIPFCSNSTQLAPSEHETMRVLSKSLVDTVCSLVLYTTWLVNASSSPAGSYVDQANRQLTLLTATLSIAPPAARHVTRRKCQQAPHVHVTGTPVPLCAPPPPSSYALQHTRHTPTGTALSPSSGSRHDPHQSPSTVTITSETLEDDMRARPLRGPPSSDRSPVRAAPWLGSLLGSHRIPTPQATPLPAPSTRIPTLPPAAAAKARRLLPTPDLPLPSPPTSDRNVNLLPTPRLPRKPAPFQTPPEP